LLQPLLKLPVILQKDSACIGKCGGATFHIYSGEN